MSEGKLLITIKELAALLSVSKSLLYQWDSSGKLGPIGSRPSGGRGRRLFDPEEIQAWVKAGCPARCEWLRQRGSGS